VICQYLLDQDLGNYSVQSNPGAHHILFQFQKHIKKYIERSQDTAVLLHQILQFIQCIMNDCMIS
jgi:hypothetical protein